MARVLEVKQRGLVVWEGPRHVLFDKLFVVVTAILLFLIFIEQARPVEFVDFKSVDNVTQPWEDFDERDPARFNHEIDKAYLASSEICSVSVHELTHWEWILFFSISLLKELNK